MNIKIKRNGVALAMSVTSVADLRGVDLRGADLREAVFRGATLQQFDLSNAYLCGVDLHGADMRWSILRRARLHRANMRETKLFNADMAGAMLPDADLQHANLYCAILREADLRRAWMREADLREADLREADLRGAYLQGARLQGADLTGAILPDYQICPPAGSFIAYKRLHASIAILEVPAEAKRTSTLVGRKCRAEFAKVLSISGCRAYDSSLHDPSFVYRVGEIACPDHYNDDIRIECANGIHFFMTGLEAEDYQR